MPFVSILSGFSSVMIHTLFSFPAKVAYNGGSSVNVVFGCGAGFLPSRLLSDGKQI
jgi:hypothetical protein